jgi:hypothetical protein
MKNNDNAKQEAQQMRAPSWMNKPERRAFAAAISERLAHNRRVSAEEVDCLIDYTAARSRLATLHKLWRRTVAEGGQFRNDDDHILKIARQLDSATASCRRLAKALAMPSADHRKKEGARVKGARVDDKPTLANDVGMSGSGREAAR